MVSEVVDKVEREALEVKVVEEEARDKELESSKDYTGLIPEVPTFYIVKFTPGFVFGYLPSPTPTQGPKCYKIYGSLPGVPGTKYPYQVYQATATALLGELEEDSEALEVCRIR